MNARKQPKAGTQNGQESGFTLMELMIVLAVMMVVAVAAFPSIINTLEVIRLRSSADNVAGLLQRSRIRSVKDNRVYSVLFTNGGNTACIDLNWSGACDASEPNVQLARRVSFVTDGSGVAYAVIACGSMTSVSCPAGFNGLNYTPQVATVAPSYNARGLPCVASPASPPPAANTPCSEFDVNTPPNNPPVGFLYELQYTGGNGNNYAAISITPSGLVSVWLYDGNSWGQE